MKNNIAVKTHLFFIRKREENAFSSFWGDWVKIEDIGEKEAIGKYAQSFLNLRSKDTIVDIAHLDNSEYRIVLYSPFDDRRIGWNEVQCTKRPKDVETFIEKVKNFHNKFQYLIMEKHYLWVMAIYWVIFILQMIFLKVLLFKVLLFCYITLVWVPISFSLMVSGISLLRNR